MTNENKRYGVFLVKMENHRLDCDAVVINAHYKPLYTYIREDAAHKKCAALNSILARRPGSMAKQRNVVREISERIDIELYQQQKIAEEGKDIDTPERKARRLAELKAQNQADGLIK
ncbi:TPA: hypothetical protein ACSUN1_003109 [Salmonella enterica subsp. diarizonae]